MDKGIIPNDSRYIPLTQQKFCCVPTCIQMIMLRRGLRLVPAELLGWHMGLTVPEEDVSLFWNPRSGPRPAAGYGTRLGEEEFSANAAFRKLGIPLEMRFKLIDELTDIDNFKEYINHIEANDLDVLACFDWGAVFSSEPTGGHVCLVDAVDHDNSIVRLIDPEYKTAKWANVAMLKLFHGMKVHGKSNMAGFWEVFPSNK